MSTASAVSIRAIPSKSCAHAGAFPNAPKKPIAATLSPRTSGEAYPNDSLEIRVKSALTDPAQQPLRPGHRVRRYFSPDREETRGAPARTRSEEHTSELQSHL